MTSHATNSQSAILESILCPILKIPMKNPFQGSDGKTYEYDAIVTWLNKKQVSPLTNAPMTISDLHMDSGMRYLCDKYHSGDFGDVEIKNDSKILNNADFTITDKTYFNKNTNELFIKMSSLGSEEFDMKSAPPVDIVVTVDRSGSTGDAVESQNADGSKMEVGYSIRDILVHGAKTIISSMRPCDRVCIIMFDNEIEIVVPLQQMTPLNRSSACANVENSIRPRGTTNIYGSIKKGIEIIDEREDKTRNAAIMVLTDGQPNISPARGEVRALEKLQKETNFSSPIYTFGFGYNLKPGLLYGLAKTANASTGHIPDGGMVATVFSNYLAMIMSTACVNLELKIKSSDIEFDEKSVMGDFPITISDDKKEITIRGGTVQFQQSRDFAIHLGPTPSTLEFHYSYEIGGKKFQSPVQISNTTNDFKLINTFDQSEKDESDYQRLRLWTSQQLRDAIYIKSVVPDQDSTIALYKNIVSTIEQVNHPKATALLATVKDQVFMILGSDKIEHRNYYKKWGEFYLDLLSSSLLRQHTANFKDEACNVFGDKCFKNCVDHIADVFDSLPPPKPSLKVYNTATRSYQRGVGVASMSSYNNSSGGCWSGCALITMADGSKKRSDQIQPGDEIKTLPDFKSGKMFKTTTVLKIVQTNLPTGECEMVDFPNKQKGGITPWHPIEHNGSFVFPNQIGETHVEKCDSLFNFICSHTHFALVNDTPCITLGHSYKVGILAHPYFGSKQVVKDLSLIDGFKEGKIVIYPHWFQRGGPDLENRGRCTIDKISPHQ